MSQTPPLSTPGHPLSDEEFRGAVGAVDFAVDARYAWDAGIAIGEFLRGLKRGRILARECLGPCGRILVPPRMFCEEDFRPTDRWVEARDTGTVNTFSLCYVTWDMRPLEDPEIPAVIEIDGSNGGFLHKLDEVAKDAVRVGMEVEAVWLPEEKRTGSILDIRYFRPRDESLRAEAKAGRSAETEPEDETGGSV
jgi:uncharacterized OB-fold protein